MDETLFFAEGTGTRKNKIVLVIIALFSGLLISIAVWQLGWVALLAVPATVVVLSTVSNPDFGLAALIILIFVQLQRVATKIYDLPGPGDPLVAFLIMVVAIRVLMFNERPMTWLKNSFIILIYLIFLVISALAAGDMAPALSELFDVAQNLVIASIVLFMIQRTPSLRNAIWAVIAAGMLMGTISVIQRITGNYTSLFWGFGGWEYSGYVGRPRLAGPYATPNPYAQVLVIIVILALDRTLHSKRILFRGVAAYAVLVTSLALIFTDSRGGFVDLVFTLFVFFLFERPNVPTVLVVLLIGMVVASYLPANFTDRISTLTELLQPADQATLTDESFRGRTSENLAAWRMFLDNPILGVGLNNYRLHYQDYSREIGLDPRRVPRDPASLYLQILANQGIVGAIVFVVFMASVFLRLLHAYQKLKARKMSDEAYMASALFAAYAGYMFMSLYKNSAYTNVFWVLIAMCFSVTQILENAEDADVEVDRPLEIKS